MLSRKVFLAVAAGAKAEIAGRMWAWEGSLVCMDTLVVGEIEFACEAGLADVTHIVAGVVARGWHDVLWWSITIGAGCNVVGCGGMS